MSSFESIIDQKIREAMEKGEFDNLPGTGKPLELQEGGDPEWRMAHRLLKNNGFSLPWIEDQKSIERELNTARTDLERAWRIRSSIRNSGTEERWNRSLENFRSRLAMLNSSILTYNLQVPPHFQRPLVDLQREQRTITGEDREDARL